MRKALRRIDWLTRSTSGSYWVAYCSGTLRGSVTKLNSGIYQVNILGRRNAYCHSMRDAAKQLVAYLNNLKPSSL